MFLLFLLLFSREKKAFRSMDEFVLESDLITCFLSPSSEEDHADESL